MTLEEFIQGWKGQKLAPLFDDDGVIERMERLNRLGVPAIKAIDGAVADAVGTLDDVERQHVGRWVRNTLARRGWRSVKQRSWRGGRVFASGMIYEPVARTINPRADAGIATPKPHWEERVLARADEAIAMLAGARIGNAGSVDDFIAERRAEARRDER